MARPSKPSSPSLLQVISQKIKNDWHAFKEPLLYDFDKRMVAGFWAQLALLAMAMVVLVSLGAVVLMLFHIWEPSQGNFSPDEALWSSLMHAMDTGTVSGDSTRTFRVVMLIVSVLGVGVMAGFISVATNALQEQLARVRKGRSPVREEDYKLILGWSPAVFNVVCELIEANEKKRALNKRKWRVVILASKDKVEMEDEMRVKLRQRFASTAVQHADATTARHVWLSNADLRRYNNRIVFRTGNPTDVDDLNIVKPRQAKYILVLSPPLPETDPDLHVIKTILAVQHAPHHHKDRIGLDAPWLVYELRDAEKYREVAELIEVDKSGLSKICRVESGADIARIIAQTCRQAGMSEIYAELLEYNQAQVYIKEAEPALVDKTFEEALLLLPRAALIGLKRGDEILLNPLNNEKTTDAQQQVIKMGDGLIVIAASEDELSIGLCETLDRGPIVSGARRKPNPEQTLILGWNKRGPQILNELNTYVEFGSHVTVVAGKEEFCTINWQYEKETKQKVTFQKDDPTKGDVLRALEIGNFEHIIVLGDHDLPPHQADMNTLMTLLNLRAIVLKRAQTSQTACPELSIVGEMIVDSNRKLAEATRLDNAAQDERFGRHDFIVSHKIISSLMTQISQTHELKEIFEELLTERGMEIYLKPARNYVKIGQPINFSTVVAAAIAHRECAIGYRQWSQHHQKSERYGVKINPKKSDEVTFGPRDRIIVIAEKEWDETSTPGEAPVTLG